MKKKYNWIFLSVFVSFLSCEKVKDLSDEASVEKFEIVNYTPETAVLDAVYMDGGDIIIPVQPQSDLFPFTLHPEMTVSSTTHKVLGNYTLGEDIVFSSGESVVDFYLIAESGFVHPYKISLYPLETGADIKGLVFDGSNKTTITIDPWEAKIYISDPNRTLGDGEAYMIKNASFTVSENANVEGDMEFEFTDYNDVWSVTVVSSDGKRRDWKIQFTELIQIPNSNFELWGKFAGINNGVTTVDPVLGKGKGWATANNSFVLGTEPVTHNNGKAAQMTTKVQNASVFGKVIAAGSLYTGYFDLNINALGDSRSMTYFGIPYTLRPKAMEFDARYEAGAQMQQAVKEGLKWAIKDVEGVDSGHAWIELLHYSGNDKFEYHARPTEKVVVLGRGEMIFDGKMSSLKNWSHYSIPIEYTNEDLLPTHVAIVFSSSKNGDQYLGAPGSVMEVDNVELIY